MPKPARSEEGVEKRLSNQEIVTVAVFLLGGASVPVDTEDVAMRANSLAPGRFAWRKYPAQINIETVRKRLWDARRPDVCGLVAGSEKTGWALTEKGLRVARELASRLEGVDLSRDRVSLAERRWRAAERRRLLASEAFDKLCHSGENAVSRREAEAFFRLDEYVTGERRERKVVRILDAFSQDPELGQAVRLLVARVRGGNRQ